MEPDTPQARIAARPPFTSVLRAVVSHRGVQTVAILWLAGTATALWLARGSLPFDRPAVAGLPFVFQMAAPTVGLIEIFGLMAVVFILTRTRAIPDMAARAPERRIAWRETGLVLAYAALGQAGGWIVGPALGYRPFSFHIAGTVFGCTVPPEPAEVWTRFAPQYRAVASVVLFQYFGPGMMKSVLTLRTGNAWVHALGYHAIAPHVVIDTSLVVRAFRIT